MKMYCIVAKDSLKAMNGNRGKLSAQSVHAFLHAYWDAEARGMPQAEPCRASGMAKKAALAVDTADDLKPLYETYRAICGVSMVGDGFGVLKVLI